MIGYQSEKAALCQTDCKSHGSRCKCASSACCSSIKSSSNSLGSFFSTNRAIEKIVGLVDQCCLRKQRRAVYN